MNQKYYEGIRQNGEDVWVVEETRRGEGSWYWQDGTVKNRAKLSLNLGGDFLARCFSNKADRASALF